MGSRTTVGTRITRRLLAGGAFAALGAVTVAIGPAPARADHHDHVTVSGDDLAAPVSVVAEEQPERHSALLAEVRWLIDRPAGDTPEPEPDDRGRQYTMVVHVEGEPRHQFELYPLHTGGPRVFRPAEQPDDRTVDEAWFLGRLSLPETLRAAGVPLDGGQIEPGGVGGGGATTPDGTPKPDADLLGFLGEWRETVLLTSGLAAAILAGVASVAFLVRRDP